ncbi:GGDEF domain-containing protein [Clostridium algidicarnis]|nr:GGDEF domain-containing protein [Clostridium algidicarnis]
MIIFIIHIDNFKSINNEYGHFFNLFYVNKIY